MNPQRTGALFTHAGDLYFCSFDGAQSVRLTKSPGAKELATFSPNGQWVAFVREQNLWVVNLATQTERALTSDGGGPLSYGKAEWVYFKEVFLQRSRHTGGLPIPHTSPSCARRLARSQIHGDRSSAGPRASRNHGLSAGRRPESDGRAGDGFRGRRPHPLGRPRKLLENAMLIVRAGWTPDSRTVYYYVQDRRKPGSTSVRSAAMRGHRFVFSVKRQRPGSDDPGDPVFLQDGSFLLASRHGLETPLPLREGWQASPGHNLR